MSVLSKTKARDARLRRVYGITLEQYNGLLKKQNGRCPICLRLASSFPINLAVDHDHKTREVRGLVCSYCNHRIIGRHRDAGLLRRVADYLAQGTGWFVPVKAKRKRKKRRVR